MQVETLKEIVRITAYRRGALPDLDSGAWQEMAEDIGACNGVNAKVDFLVELVKDLLAKGRALS